MTTIGAKRKTKAPVPKPQIFGTAHRLNFPSHQVISVERLVAIARVGIFGTPRPLGRATRGGRTRQAAKFL